MHLRQLKKAQCDLEVFGFNSKAQDLQNIIESLEQLRDHDTTPEKMSKFEVECVYCEETLERIDRIHLQPKRYSTRGESVWLCLKCRRIFDYSADGILKIRGEEDLDEEEREERVKEIGEDTWTCPVCRKLFLPAGYLHGCCSELCYRTLRGENEEVEVTS